MLKFKFLGNKAESSLSKGENKILFFEDGLDKMSFINDEIALLTTKKMLNSFDLINNGGYNLDIENEKMIIDNLSKKIIIYFQNSKNKENTIKEDKKKINNIENEFTIIDINKEEINIKEKEIKLFEKLLDKHHNRIIFLQNLNFFRATGKLEIPKKLYSIILILY